MTRLRGHRMIRCEIQVHMCNKSNPPGIKNQFNDTVKEFVKTSFIVEKQCSDVILFFEHNHTFSYCIDSCDETGLPIKRIDLKESLLSS